MRIVLLAAALSTTLCTLAGAAYAETTVIERREAPDVVVRERPADVIERREVPVGGCDSKTVTRTDEDGNSTTVHRERCD